MRIADLYTLYLLAKPKYVSWLRLAKIMTELSYDIVNRNLGSSAEVYFSRVRVSNTGTVALTRT